MSILPKSWTLLAVAGVALAGCTDGYGYSGVSVGYASPGYYSSAYDYDGFGGPGYAAYGDGYYGWYGGYYYPGTGYYVYDQARRSHRWNDRQRSYWEARRQAWRGNGQGPRGNWQGFRNDAGDRGSWQSRRFDRQRSVGRDAATSQPSVSTSPRTYERGTPSTGRSFSQPRTYGGDTSRGTGQRGGWSRRR